MKNQLWLTTGVLSAKLRESTWQMKNVQRTCAAAACSVLLSSVFLAATSTLAAAAERAERLLGPVDIHRLIDPTEDQLQRAKAATEKYRDINVAVAEGYFQGGAAVPGEGFHYLNPSRLGCTFDLEKPAILLYALLPGKTQLRLVSLEYAIPFGCMPADGPPPEGFIGSADVWHNDEPVPFWTVNAWIYLVNPDGVFTLENPRVP